MLRGSPHARQPSSDRSGIGGFPRNRLGEIIGRCGHVAAAPHDLEIRAALQIAISTYAALVRSRQAKKPTDDAAAEE